jgi:uncharacterized protein (TIGR01777 family)
LLQASIDVVNLVRHRTEASVKAFQWDPAKPEMPMADVAGLEACDYAVHLSGANLSTHRWTPAYKKTILDSRVDSSRALIQIFSRLKTPPRVLVCASATGIYGDRGDEVLTEASAAGSGFLPGICKAWEQAPDAAKALGIRVVHLRFGVVLAPAGGALAKLLPVFKAALGGQLGDGHQWMSWVTLEDVVRGILFALQTETVQGPYNVVAPDPVTNKAFTRALAKAVHRPAPWIVPEFALKAMFGQMAQDTLLASTRAMPERLMTAGFEFASPELVGALDGLLK